MEPTNIPLGLQYDDGNMRDIPPGIPESSRPRAQNPGTNESMSTMKRQALGFGSDTSFQSHHFAPPPGSEDPKAVEGRIMKTLDQLENSGSAENTQPSSPILEKSRRDFRGPNTSSRNLELDNITGPNGEGTELVSPTEKRRRKAKDEDLDSDSGDDDDDVEDLHRPAKKSKPNVKERTSIDSSKGNRRKSQSSDQKPARQNLTEGEKKLNHIKSEQKRRNQIKEGFSNLTTLMPDGVSASASKCAILTKAVQWMDELIAGNKKLKAQLDSMQ